MGRTGWRVARIRANCARCARDSCSMTVSRRLRSGTSSSVRANFFSDCSESSEKMSSAWSPERVRFPSLSPLPCPLFRPVRSSSFLSSILSLSLVLLPRFLRTDESVEKLVKETSVLLGPLSRCPVVCLRFRSGALRYLTRLNGSSLPGPKETGAVRGAFPVSRISRESFLETWSGTRRHTGCRVLRVRCELCRRDLSRENEETVCLRGQCDARVTKIICRVVS